MFLSNSTAVFLLIVCILSSLEHVMLLFWFSNMLFKMYYYCCYYYCNYFILVAVIYSPFRTDWWTEEHSLSSMYLHMASLLTAGRTQCWHISHGSYGPLKGRHSKCDLPSLMSPLTCCNNSICLETGGCFSVNMPLSASVHLCTRQQSQAHRQEQRRRGSCGRLRGVAREEL